MAIDLTSAARAPEVTETIATVGGQWDLVNLPTDGRVRFVEVQNTTGASMSVRLPAVADAAAYASTDDQFVIADGATKVLLLARGRGQALRFSFSIYTPAVQAEVRVSLRQS